MDTKHSYFYEIWGRPACMGTRLWSHCLLHVVNFCMTIDIVNTDLQALPVHDQKNQEQWLCWCEYTLYIWYTCRLVDLLKRVRIFSYNLVQSHGVPQFFGIYYAMGIALILEGFMSSLYHICPSNANFQFGELFLLWRKSFSLTIYMYTNRHCLHVHHWRYNSGEGISESSPQCPSQCLCCLLCICCDHIVHCHRNCKLIYNSVSVIILFLSLSPPFSDLWILALIQYKDRHHPLSVKLSFFFLALLVIFLFLTHFYSWNYGK